MVISQDLLTGIIAPIALWFLGKIFDAVSKYFKSKSDTLEKMEKTLLEMQFQMKNYDEKLNEIPRMKKGMDILFRKVGLNDVPQDSLK